jgi:hypothetical protein
VPESFRLREGAVFFKQFYLGCLAHASYLVGSEGEAAVVDSAATSLLAREGFRNLLNVTGGTAAWIEAGYAVE